MVPPTMKESIALALDKNNLRAEAYYPLIHFAKSKLNINIEKEARSQIIEWAKHFIKLNKDSSLSKKILSSLDNAIEYIQNSISKAKPKFAQSFLNYVKDKYGKKIVQNFLETPDNKNKLIEVGKQQEQFEK